MEIIIAQSLEDTTRSLKKKKITTAQDKYTASWPDVWAATDHSQTSRTFMRAKNAVRKGRKKKYIYMFKKPHLNI